MYGSKYQKHSFSYHKFNNFLLFHIWVSLQKVCALLKTIWQQWKFRYILRYSTERYFSQFKTGSKLFLIKLSSKQSSYQFAYIVKGLSFEPNKFRIPLNWYGLPLATNTTLGNNQRNKNKSLEIKKLVPNSPT